MLSDKKKKEVLAYLNARATWEMDNVPYIDLTPKLKNNTDNLIWLTEDVENFLFDLIDTFGRDNKKMYSQHCIKITISPRIKEAFRKGKIRPSYA